MQTQLHLIEQILSDKKATDIVLFDFKEGHFIHDYMILASANNPRLLHALSDYLLEAFEMNTIPIHHQEGTPESGWILIDLPRIVIHLFLEEMRTYYQLDILWADKKVELYVD